MNNLVKNVWKQLEDYSYTSQNLTEDGNYGIIFRTRTQQRHLHITATNDDVKYNIYVISIATVIQNNKEENINNISSIQENQPEFTKLNDEELAGTKDIILPNEAKGIKIIFTGLSSIQTASLTIEI